MIKFLVFCLITLLLVSCAGNSPAPTTTSAPTIEAAEPAADQTMKITTSAFADGQPIPQKYTCSGENVSPALAWSGVPASAKSLALVTEDPDAPSGTFIHWVLYNLPPSLSELPEKVPTGAAVEGLGSQGSTGFGKPGYGGPCPPAGKPHRYYFKLYALDLAPQLASGLNAAGLQQQMQGHILAQAQWMGTFQR